MGLLRHSATWRYGVAAALAGLAIVLRLLLNPWLGPQVPFITLFAAVAATAWFAGARAGWFCTLLGALAAFWLWPPANTVAAVVSLLAYLTGCGVITLLAEVARKRSLDAEQVAGVLAQQRILLQEMIDALPMLVAYVDREHRYQLNNRAYGEWFGVEAASLAGKHLRDFVGAESYEKVRAHIERALSGQVVHYEASLALPRGTRDLAVTYAPHVVGDTVEGFFAIVEDISERRRTEHARAHLAAIVDSSRDAIVSKSLEGIVQSWNRGAERLFGWTEAEMVGQSITRVIPEARLHEEVDILARLARGEQLTGIETERLHRDGHLVPVSLTISPVYDSAGKIIGASKIARDISERRRREAERMQEARRKDEFLATLAHELRNPLAPILSAAQAMPPESLSDPRLLTARNMIERQARHMTRLVDDLLDLSRISHGQIVLRKRPMDLREALDAALETCQPQLQRAGLSLERDVVSGPLAVEGDATRLAQIISNLVGNAAKFTPEGGRISVRLIRVGEEARLEVADTGIGIAPDMLERIFEMFAQAGAAGEKGASGLGIGLWLARQLAQLHGGRLSAHSEGPGHGACFTLALPLSSAELGTEATGSPEPRSGSLVLSVLIADDNVDAAKSLAMLLRMDGHAVEVVHDGDAAVERIAGRRPDVALLDLGMPGRDGYEVARCVRSMEQGDQVKLVALTGWGQEEARRRSKEAGFDAHLTKPADAQEIEDTLRRLCAPGPAGQLER